MHPREEKKIIDSFSYGTVIVLELVTILDSEFPEDGIFM